VNVGGLGGEKPGRHVNNRGCQKKNVGRPKERLVTKKEEYHQKQTVSAAGGGEGGKMKKKKKLWNQTKTTKSCEKGKQRCVKQCTKLLKRGEGAGAFGSKTQGGEEEWSGDYRAVRV